MVGAGIVGLACAWRLAERGLDVVCLDRDEPGSGASRAAAGMLAPVTEAEFAERELYELNLAGAGRWPAFADDLGVDVGHRESGALTVAADRDEAEELRRVHSFRATLGVESEWLSGRDCRRLEPSLSPRVAGGMLAPGDAQVDPRAVTAALAERVEVVSGAAAGIEPGRVSLEDGSAIEAATVVVAAGAWSGLIDGAPPVRPVKGQILRLRGPALAKRIVRTPRCYVVPRTDGRVVLGATVEEMGWDERVTAEGVFRLLEGAREVLPGIDLLELEEAGAGLRPGTPDNGPAVGEKGGLLWATGHYRNGILLAPITAEAVAALATGEQPPAELDGFGPGRFGVRQAATT